MKTKKIRGIAFTGAPQIQSDKKNKWVDPVILLTVSILLLASIEGILLNTLQLSVNLPVLIIGSVFGLTLCHLFYLFPKSRIAVGAAFLLCLIAIAVFPGGFFRDGMAITANSALDVLGCTFGRVYLPLSVSGSVSAVAAATVFQLAVTLILCVFCTYMVCGQDKVILLLAALIFIAACLFLVFSPFWLWYGLFFVALAFVLLKQLVKAKSGETRGKLMAAAGSLMFILAALLFVLFGTVFSVNHYEKPAFAEKIENGISSAIERIIYGSDTTNNLPQGDFTKIAALKLTDKTALKITMSQPESLYLRGYVGSVYTSSGWQDIDKKTLYSDGELFYWLHKDGFYGFSQLDAAATAAGEVSDDDKLSISVAAVGTGDKYIYTPYEYIGKEDTEALYRIGDIAPNRKDFPGEKSYTFETLTNLVKSSASLARTLSTLSAAGDEKVNSYLNDESYYRKFVYENYLELPAKDQDLLQTHLGDDIYKDGSHADYDVAMQAILDYLYENITYDENVSAPTDGEDFLTYFLDYSAKGYSVHYATAAALMFRYYGIPARYVEGYIVTPDDVAGVKADETVELTGKNAHAWVEYYRDGVGWVPFEVTPSYLFVMEQPENEAALISDDYDDDSSKKGSIEMTDDNYEELDDDDTSKEEDDAAVSPVLVAAVGGSSLLLLLLAGFVALAVRRGLTLKKRRKALSVKTERAAVNDIFDNTLTLLFVGGLKKDNGSLENYIEPLREQSNTGLSLRYRMLLALHREAQFSDHPLSTERRRVFEAFQREVVADFKARTKLRKRFKEKYIKNRY